MPRPHRAEALSDDARLTSVCLSAAYIGPKSKTERPRKTKIGTEVAHVTRDSDTTFKLKRSKVNLQWAGAYCTGLPHSLYINVHHADPFSVLRLLFWATQSAFRLQKSPASAIRKDFPLQAFGGFGQTCRNLWEKREKVGR